MSLDNEIFNDHVEHGTAEDTRNQFVFHNNEEFKSFQRCFVVDGNPPYDPIYSNPADSSFQYFPSNVCDHISLTFMYNGGQPYQIINNRAFFLKGFTNIVIQGARSERSNGSDVPILEVFNEVGENKTPIRAYDFDTSRIGDNTSYEDDHTCHSFGTDDAIFNIQNEHENPANIVISDIEFRVAFSLYEVEHALMYKQWYNPYICPVLFKVYEASSFKMFNVRMYSQFLDFTHVFIHWCENVDITNCKFENYNARKIGGNLWLCQRVKNVTIVNNDFYKYGNDENIGIWGDSIISRAENHCYDDQESLSKLDKAAFANRLLDFEHIHIKNNRFYYGKPEHSFGSTTDIFPDYVRLASIHAAQQSNVKWGGVQDLETDWEEATMDIFQTLYFSQHTPKHVAGITQSGTESSESPSGDEGLSEKNESTELNSGDNNDVIEDLSSGVNFTPVDLIVPYAHYNVSDFVVDANEYYIDSPMKTLMGMTFDNFCNTEGIKITNNLIKYGPWAHGQCQLQDFKIVYDKNPDWDPTSQQLEGSNKTCLDPVLIEGNTIDCKALAYFEYRPTSNNGSTSNPTTGHIEVPLVPYRVEEHFILDIENAAVTMNNNVVNCYIEPGNEETDFATTSLNIDDLGFMLLYSREKGGRVTMNNNIFRGMKNMGSFRMPTDNTFSRIELIANNNVFQGSTVFFNEYMKDGVFKFTNNLFIAEHPILLLQEMPLSTLLVIQNNVFKRQSENAAVANLYFSNYNKDKDTTPPQVPLPTNMTVISSGNKFENIVGNICPNYAIQNLSIYSANEHPINSDFSSAQ